MTDTLADLLTRIRNAQKARKDTVSIPYSKLKHEVAKKLLEAKFVANVTVEKVDKFDNLVIELDHSRQYELTLTRISKCGQRVYKKASELKPVKSGLGIEILSTSKGVMTNEEAKKANIGGEVICSIY